jgi:hypothetical protein
MKKLLILAALCIPSAAYADVTHKLTNSIQLTTDGAYTVSERGASSYSVSGSNIKVSDSQTFGGLTAGTNGAAPTMTNGTYEMNTVGSAFSFSESFIEGDDVYAVGSGADVSTGVIADLPVLSKTTSYSGGVAGSLAGTVVGNHTNTCTAGGAGTTCIGQFVTDLTID